MFTSMTWAPAATCSRATSSAAAKSPVLMSLRNLAEPVTFVRSPTFTNGMSGLSTNGSSPDSRISGATSGTSRGALPATAAAMARMCAGEVPQQPPTTLTRPDAANSPTSPAIASGLSS